MNATERQEFERLKTERYRVGKPHWPASAILPILDDSRPQDANVIAFTVDRELADLIVSLLNDYETAGRVLRKLSAQEGK